MTKREKQTYTEEGTPFSAPYAQGYQYGLDGSYDEDRAEREWIGYEGGEDSQYPFDVAAELFSNGFDAGKKARP